MREKQAQTAFLFGVDDHWGPLSMYEEVCDKFISFGLDFFLNASSDKSEAFFYCEMCAFSF